MADALVGHVVKPCISCGTVGIAGSSERDPAKLGWQEGRSEVVGSPVQGGRADCDEAGEIIIVAAQPVVDPRTHAGPQKCFVSGMHFHACTSVGNICLTQ